MTTVRYAVAVVPNMSTPNLSKADNLKVEQTAKDKAGHIVFTETVGTDDTQLPTVFPEKDYRLTALASENNIVVRRARWPAASEKALAPHKDVLAKFKARPGTDPGKAVAKTVTPFVKADGSIRANGYWYMGTSRAHVQPLRSASFDIWEWADAPGFTPGADVGIHLVSSVRKSIGATYDYRAAEREEQRKSVQAGVNTLLDAGINVYLYGDPNWLDPALHFRGTVHKFVTDKYAICWFIESPTSNWTARLVAPGVEVINNPADHDARVVSQEAVAKSSPPPPPPPVDGPLTTGIEAFIVQYGVKPPTSTKLLDAVRGL